MMRFFTLAALAAPLLFSVGCGGDAQSKNPTPDEYVPPVPVEARAVHTGDIAAVFVGTATLEAEEEAAVVAKVGGIVTEIFVEEGHFVQAGQALAKLDDERLTLELQRTEVNLRKLQQEFERNEELYQKKLISTEAYERVKYDFEMQQSVRDLARLELTYTTVRAPISGVVSDRLIKVGNMVRANEPVFHVTDFDPLLAVMHVPERELHKIQTGQVVRLSAGARPGETFEGRVKRISPTIDAGTGTFQVTIEVRDRTRQLKPGMFARIQLRYDSREQALLVPKEAVVTEDDRSTVFVIQDSLALRRNVQIGYSDDLFIELISGVSEGEFVITTGQRNLRDSSKVEVVE